MARVTLRQVATAAGVSVATVSNAYNPAKSDQLSLELRGRILELGAELGFTGPDPAGRALRSGQADAVGVLMGERLSYAFSDPFAIEFLAGVTEEVEQDDLSVVLVPLAEHDRRDDPLAAVRRASVDALAILTLWHDHPAAQLARRRGIRLVLNNTTDDPDDSWVVVDDHRAGVLLGTHLAEYGHRDVLVIASTAAPAGTPGRALAADQVAGPGIEARIRGLVESISGDVTLVTGGHNSLDAGKTAVAWALEHRPRATAVVGLSDVLALGALHELRRRRLSVPADWSVAGFDDVGAAGQDRLSTVRQPILLRGRHVGRMLRDPESQPRQVVMPVSLVQRDTVGPPRQPPGAA